MSDTTTDKKFDISPRTDPNQLLAIRTRELACDDPNLSDGAVRLFVRLLDMALNPRLNNEHRGQIIVSQMKLAFLLSCTERSIRRRTIQLIRENYLWTTLLPRPNTKPILVYHITAFQPERQVEQQMAGDGLWGNGKRRFDTGFARTGKEAAGGATGHKRPMGWVLLDRLGNPIFSVLAKKAPATGHESPVSPDKNGRWERTVETPATGQNCPVTPALVSAHTGQNCPVTADNFDRSEGTPASDYRESQIERESSLTGGKTPTPDKSFEEWVKGFGKDPFRSKLERARDDLRKALSRLRTDDGRGDCKRRLAWLEEKLVMPREAAQPAHQEKPKPKSKPEPLPDKVIAEGLEKIRKAARV